MSSEDWKRVDAVSSDADGEEHASDISVEDWSRLQGDGIQDAIVPVASLNLPLVCGGILQNVVSAAQH